MTVALYSDYIADLRAVFAELDQHPDRFQTFSLHVDLTAAGSLIVYETKRRKGQTDSIYYGRPANAGSNQKISQATAFAAIDRFFSLGQFLAVKVGANPEDAESGGLKVHAEYPHCAVNFTYRKKGHPVTRSMLMIFVGFNDDVDALRYAAEDDHGSSLISQRPYHSSRVFEWNDRGGGR